MRYPKILLAVCCVLSANLLRAAEYSIGPDTDLKTIVKKVKAGDSIVLRDGTWIDADLKFEQLPGEPDSPIQIRAQTPGKVVLTGETQLRFSGSYITVSGFVIRDPTGVSDVVQFRTHSERHAHHCRLTECVIEETAESKPKNESRWVSVYGTNNRVDNCYFAGKKNRGTTLVVWVAEQPEHHRVDHNHFGPRPELGKNGGETIRIGTSDVSEFDSGTIVEDNYLHACNGESEIISNKSCGNIYRHNTFDECSGALTLRHGHRCVVDGNVFFGRKQSGTGGVRIIGSGHSVTNNYFEGLRGDAERAALSMMNCIEDSPLNGYSPVRNATVAHNTFVDCKVSIELGVGAGTKQPVAPANSVFSCNVFVPGKWEVFRIQSEPTGFQWLENKLQPVTRNETLYVEFENTELPLKLADDGMLRPEAIGLFQTKAASETLNDIDGGQRRQPTICGCDDPRTPPRKLASAANTGPLWIRTQK